MRYRGNARVVDMLPGLAAVLVLVALITPASAHAIDIDALRARLEEDRAGRRERIERLRDSIRDEGTDTEDPAPAPDPDEDSNNEEPAPAPECSCSASLGFASPDVHWRNNTLEFVPRFDVAIRVRGEEGAPPWSLALNYEGTAHTTPFADAMQFGGQCFDTRNSFSGLAGAPVTIGDIIRSAFGSDDELNTTITMRGALTGCDTDTEARQARVSIEEFGNLDVNRWRFLRR